MMELKFLKNLRRFKATNSPHSGSTAIQKHHFMLSNTAKKHAMTSQIRALAKWAVTSLFLKRNNLGTLLKNKIFNLRSACFETGVPL